MSWRPVVWLYGPSSPDVVCVGRRADGTRHRATFRGGVYAYVSGADETEVARAALATGATVERADVRSIYAEPHAPMTRVSAPTRDALASKLRIAIRMGSAGFDNH